MERGEEKGEMFFCRARGASYGKVTGSDHTSKNEKKTLRPWQNQYSTLLNKVLLDDVERGGQTNSTKFLFTL